MLFRLRHICAVFVIALVVCSASVSAQAKKRKSANWNYPPEIPGARTEVYKRVGDVELKLWIFEKEPAATATKRPAIVFFFGGGWRSGTPGQFYEQCKYLASRGMVAMTADYRVSSRHGVKATACVEDAKSAVRWVRTHADELGIDPDKIVAAGGSAGGHIAACTGTVDGFEGENKAGSSVPNAMALFNPAVVLAPISGGQSLPEKSHDTLQERIGADPKTISPAHHVKADQPPTIIFHGEADPTVPFWTVERFTKEMQSKGNRCELKAYPFAVHGFFNYGRGGSEQRIDQGRRYFERTMHQLDEFLVSLNFLSGDSTLNIPKNKHVHLRSGFANCWQKFENGTGHVVFMGGSITEGNGYRVLMSEWLQQQFPDCKFTFTNAGISSTCSTTGAFRLQRDVLDAGPVDLLFVEFAVNDDQDAAHKARECVRGMEGILRHARESNSMMDIVVTHFVNPPILKTLQDGKQPLSCTQHELAAVHYQASSVYLARDIAEQIRRGTMTWKQYGGTHPAPAGHAHCRDLMVDLLETAWKSKSQPQPYAMPKPIDKNSYADGNFLPADQVERIKGWEHIVPDWSAIPGSKRKRFTSQKMFAATEPGSECCIKFSGRALGAYLVAGPDAGRLSVEIDGKDVGTFELYHRYSKGLHYPRSVMFATDLSSGSHEAVIRLASDKHKNSKGPAARIMSFVVNE